MNEMEERGERLASRVDREYGLVWGRHYPNPRGVDLDPNVPRACDGAWTDGLRACRQARMRTRVRAMWTGTGMEWRA